MACLLVENNKELVFFIKRWAKDYKLDYAYTLNEAKEYLKSNKYDIILLDRTLDWGSGLDLLPLDNVVIMSTDKLDGYDNLTKPFTKLELINKIKQYENSKNKASKNS